MFKASLRAAGERSIPSRMDVPRVLLQPPGPLGSGAPVKLLLKSARVIGSDVYTDEICQGNGERAINREEIHLTTVTRLMAETEAEM